MTLRSIWIHNYEKQFIERKARNERNRKQIKMKFMSTQNADQDPDLQLCSLSLSLTWGNGLHASKFNAGNAF